MWPSPPLTKRDSSKVFARHNQNSPGPLLISVAIPTSSPCRAPKPPPSSPIRVRPSTMRRDSEDLIFAMSPDQNTFPHIPHGFHSLQPTKSAISTRYPTKHLVDRSTMKNPYPYRILLDSQPELTEDEKPVLYPVPTIKKSPPKQHVSATPKSRRHALLKPFASSTRLQSAPICSGSATSEDEDDFPPPSGSYLLPSPILDRETRATVDILDDISTSSQSPPHIRPGRFAADVPVIHSTPASPSIRNHRRGDERGSDVRMRIAESFGLDKFIGSLNPSPGNLDTKQVTRGRPKHRKIS